MKNESYEQTNFHDDEITHYLKTNHETGLTDDEVIQRQAKFGLNIINKQKKTNFFVSFVKAVLFELMSLLLFITGIIGLGLAIYENIKNSPHYVLSYVQASVLLSIVFLNALFSTIQEAKSSNAIEELRKMSSPSAKVLRNGKIKQIPSSELTIGDILIVEAGDTVSADAILISDSHLKISEGILTGESSEILKDAEFIPNENAPLGEQKNKIFAGTSVLNGKGYAIVSAISYKTEIGKIANLLDENAKNTTPLQLKLRRLGKVLGIFGIIITIVTFLFSIFVIENITSPNTRSIVAVQSSLFLAISLAAAAIPEGLNAIVTIILSIGVKKISTKNALIKRLPSVETLGSTSVICSDKTGTLTMNKMTVVKLFTYADQNLETDPQKETEAKRQMLIRASLCTDGVIDETQDIDQRKLPIGDPTEIAILDITFSWGISIANIKHQYKRVGEIPFDSDRKLMSTINTIDGKNYLIVKGAPDVVFSKCKNNDLEQAKKLNNEWSNQAIRVLAIAQKEIKEELPKDFEPEQWEFDLDFVGLIGMIDPPREEVKISIQECISAGIKPIMITGDYLNTATAIAKDLKIIQDEKKDLAISGAQLDSLSDEELNKNISKYSVYARVSPENKIRIVKAWQNQGQVVAMTGDGVNDAPALKAADMGCAMGITGTDVSKQAADMILMDDNFATIVTAVRLGRSIYENIRKITRFLLSSNITGVFAIVVGMIIFYLAFQVGQWGQIDAKYVAQHLQISDLDVAKKIANKLNEDTKFETTITTIQILINNIVIETLPGVALGTQIPTLDLMHKKPRSKEESIFADKLIHQIVIIGLIHGILTVIAFAIGVQIAINNNALLLKNYYGSIAAFITLTIGGILKSISLSSPGYFYQNTWKENKWIYVTSVVSLALVLLVITIPSLGALISEKPILSYVDNQYNQISPGSFNIEQFNSLVNNLSANNPKSGYANGFVYLVGISMGTVAFAGFEMYKWIDNQMLKKKATRN